MTMKLKLEHAGRNKAVQANGRSADVLEEARLHGASRYAVVDKLKSFITNDVVSIRRMHRDSYNVPNVPNVTSTVVLINHGDASPVYDADRRYFVISTQPPGAQVRTESRPGIGRARRMSSGGRTSRSGSTTS